MNLELLKAALVEARAKLKAYPSTIKDAEGNPRAAMTKAEIDEYQKLLSEVENLVAQIQLAESAQRQTATETFRANVPGAVSTTEAEIPKFATMSDQLFAIVRAAKMGDITGQFDKRLTHSMIRAAGANETVPSEGGFLLQEDFSTQFLNLMHTDPGILGRLTWLSLSSNAVSMRLPVIEETSRARGSRWGGVRAYWLAEAEQKIPSKPKFGEISLDLNKLACLGYVTDELLQDASIIQSIFETAFREEIMWEATDAVFNGDGVGKPLGILNSGLVEVVTKESGQANGTIVFANLVKMMNYLPVSSRSRAVWVTGDSGTETALYSVVLPGGAGYPVFLPPGQGGTPGNATFGTLLGRPVIPVEFLPGLGTEADLMLVDFSQYLAIDKGGIQQNESIHVRFIYDETCFRMVYRMGGRPGWKNKITTANGVIAKTPFVALGARS